MTNTRTDQDRFLSVFLSEWQMHRTRETTSPRTPSDKAQADSPADFDLPVACGEVRIFADFPDPVTGLLLDASSPRGWHVAPVSPFTVPASDREILIGKRVYQMWNVLDLPLETVSRSWMVDAIPPEDLADARAAFDAAQGTPLPEGLASCTGLPIKAADDPRREYERVFRLKAPPRPAAPRRPMWIYWAPALAASLLLLIGLPVMFTKDSQRHFYTVPVDCTVTHCEMPEPPPEIEAPLYDSGALPAAMRGAAQTVKTAEVDAMLNIRSTVLVKSKMGASRNTGAGGKYLSGGPLEDRRIEQKSHAPLADAAGTERYAAVRENEFLEVKTNPLSTFGLDVDTASYTTMRRYLTEFRRLPPKDSVRIEEYVNYFSYDYSEPTGDVPVAVACELGACPWNTAHKLLRVGVQAKRVPKESIPPCNLVFLIDKSGSMSYNGGFAILIQSLKLLTDQLRPEDSVAIVSYANGVQVELPATSGADKTRILQVLESLHADGATSGGEGLQLAYNEAMKNYSSKKNNRVVLITDGDFNVGISNPTELERFIAAKRETGVFLTVLGVGRGNYQDAMMKKLANVGNGNYAFLDSILEAKKLLVKEFGGTMLTVAKDVKLQLEFNPAQVGAYRLLGYENRLLAAKDFNDDKKDAGEMGSGHSMTALYELVPAGATNTVAKTDDLKYQKQVPVASGELLTVKLRYKLPNADTSTRIDQPVTSAVVTPAEPTEAFRFASAVAEFALLMKDSAYKGSASFDSVLKRARTAKGRDDDGWRAEFIRLAETAQLMEDTRPKETPQQRPQQEKKPDPPKDVTVTIDL